jgi:hypothetical protein
MHCGDTLLMPARGPLKPHLWIVVTEPVDNQCVIVSVTTLRNDRDETVTLGVGDHPFLTHASSVQFADAQFADDMKLMAQVAARNALPRQPCSQRMLKLIQDGILASPFTPKKIAAFCREQWGLAARGSTGS